MSTNDFNNLLMSNMEFLEPFSYSLTRNEEESKDLIQDTMYRALVNKDKFQEHSNIRAWLYTIMRNIFINNYRKSKKFSKVSSEVPHDYYLYQVNKVAKNDGIANTGLKEIKKAINRLPDIFRLAFEMHYIGYKYQEISDILKEPLGTIKSRIHFARKLLTSELKRN